VGAGLILLLLVVALVRLWPRMFATAGPQPVAASGRIEAREVTLAAKGIQGRVARLFADEGQTVTKGQLLAELDAAQLDAQYDAARGAAGAFDAQIAQASLDVAYTARNSAAAIAAAEAAVSAADAHIARVQAVHANARATHTRMRALFRGGAVSQEDLDRAELALRTSEADVAAAEKERARADANLMLGRASADAIALKRQQLRSLQASRRAAEARVAEARSNLAERQVIAPVDGTIISRPVEVGDVVGAGTPIFQLVDLRRLYVKVYVPEPEIGKLRLGDPADVTVDAFPGRRFRARVSRVSTQAEFTPKNVETAEERLKLVFGVELAFVAPEGVLKPGMPADCAIHWQAPR
jgi:HlyD family secretion protein